jgi:hypothetical protein
MDETYRMLGREREADFAREAQSRRLAAQARGPKAPPVTRRTRSAFRPRLAAFLLRVAR